MNTNNKKVFAASSIFMFCAVFILVVGIVASRTVVADADFYPQQEVEEKEYEPVVPFFVKQQCDIYENKPLHTLMEMICEYCHEFFNHEKPNTRSECRANCFQTSAFRRCLRLFKPKMQPVLAKMD